MLITKNSAASSSRLVWTCAAALFLTACQRSGPKSLLLAERYIQTGDYTRAIKELNHAAELLPAHPQVWNHLGLAWHYSNEPEKAAESYQRALRIDKDFAAAHLNLGVLFLERGRVNEAITELQTFVSLQPTNALGYSKLGIALTRAKRPDEAERALGQALRLNAKDAEAHNAMGLVHIQRKRPREAMMAFNAALEDRPAFSAALLNQAVVAQQFFANYSMAAERYRAFLATSRDGPLHIAVRQALDRVERNPQPGIVEPMLATETNTNRFNISALLTNRAAANKVPDQTNTKSTEVAGTQNGRTNTPPAATNVLVAKAEPASGTSHSQTVREAPGTNRGAVPAEQATRLEQVTIDDEPTLTAPKDVATMQRATTNGAETKVAAAAPTPSQPDLLAPRKSKDADKSSLMDKLKLRWFRSDEKTAPAPSVRAGGVSPEGYRTAPPQRPTPAPERPEFARYAYRNNRQLSAGDRVEAEKFFSRGAQAHLERRLGPAMEAYRRALALDPSYFEAYFNLGLAALQVKDLPVALDANETAVFLKPRSADARYHFALSLEQANYFPDAAEQLRDMLADLPDEVRAHFTLANLYAQQLDEPEQAQRHYRRVLELAPNHPEASGIRQWLAARQ